MIFKILHTPKSGFLNYYYIKVRCKRMALLLINYWNKEHRYFGSYSLLEKIDKSDPIKYNIAWDYDVCWDSVKDKVDKSV